MNKKRIVASVLLFGIANGAIWYVHPDSALNSIQTALNGCASCDTVLVGPGTYLENIIWPNTQGINLISEFGPDTTIIDGDSAGQVISIAAGVDTRTVIRGFTIQKGYVNSNVGAGICCNGSSPRIVKNVFTANCAIGSALGGGGGIGCTAGSSAIIDSNTINGNFGSTGGGIFSYGGDASTIMDNIITYNSSEWGGGLGIMTGSSPTVNGNIIGNNSATTMGGGIYCYNNVTVTIINNTITENTCVQYGAGIRCSPNTSGVIKHCTISDNIGWGIGIRQSSPDIDSCTIENNTNIGIYILDGANPAINWCSIAGNRHYGIYNSATQTINAEYNWWGDSTGPYHPDSNPVGQGDTVSNYVDFIPWIGQTWIAENPAPIEITTPTYLGPTIFRGPLQKTKGKTCRVFDIAGRLVMPEKMKPGVYFVEIDGKKMNKIIMVR